MLFVSYDAQLEMEGSNQVTLRQVELVLYNKA